MAQRQVIYVGRSQRDVQAFPEAVQDVVAQALLEAVDGFKHQDAVPMKGFHGASVLEIRASFHTDAYCVVYTTQIPEAICVLHVFKKKSRQGRETPKPDLDLIRQRLRVVTDLHARGGTPMTESEEPVVTRGSGNPFADLGMPDAELRLAKARLAQQVTAVMRERGLTQAQIASIAGIDQPQVSRITRGQLKDFSLEKLIELVRRLGVDIEIILAPRSESNRLARLTVRDPGSSLTARID